jgi:D-alanyl-D-alanine carboxypeptidase/D-alanyl-D-alanine-endopeptidase (penicillin-binding protein 4)
VPASNQKLLVPRRRSNCSAPDATLTTVVATGPVVAGLVQGDLILVGGGDPTLTATGPAASLEQLAAQLQARGITGVQGRLVVDERRYDTRRSEPGWPGSVWPSAVGSLSAVVVDRNRVIDDPAVLTEPSLVHGRRFRATLAAAGITAPEPITAEGEADSTSASAGTSAGAAPSAAVAGEQVAVIESAPLRELVAQMLGRSDNLIAEELTMELGVRGRGRGTTVDGLAVARATAAGLCLGLDGTDADGSGLSAGTTRSAAAWRRLLEAAPRRPWGAVLRPGCRQVDRHAASRLLGGRPPAGCRPRPARSACRASPATPPP